MKLTIKPRDFKRKMSEEELREHLKLRRGNGVHKSKKAYDRKKRAI